MAKPKIIDVAQLDYREQFAAGEQITWASLNAEPQTLIRALNAQLPALGGIDALISMSISDGIADEMLQYVRFKSFSGAAVNQRYVRRGHVDVIPVQLSHIPQLITDGRIKADVVLLGVAANEDGSEFSSGVSVDYLPEAIAKARLVIAEVNDTMPWTGGASVFPRDAFDLLVRAQHPVLELPPRAISDAEQAIADHIARLVPDRATLQFGIGGVPDAALANLGGKRDLGVHTGILTEPVQHLIESGAVTNRYKPIDEGRSTAAFLAGSRDFYRFCHQNPALAMYPVSYTHAAKTLVHFDDLISINSAFEVDLTGQVNAETLNGRYSGQVGGQVDFVRAGAQAPRGCAIIGLPATSRDGKHSRIVAQLSDGIATSLRTDLDVVITEYGIAELRGRTLSERAHALIDIAHPDFRHDLMAQAERLC